MTITSVLAAQAVTLVLMQPGSQAALVVAGDVELRQDVTEVREFVGTVMPVKRTVIGSAVDGRVERFLVNDGDWVPQGEPVAELLKTTIGLEVAAAKAEMELRQHELTELENGSRPEEIAQAEAAKGRAAALATYAEARMERIRALFERGTSTSQEEMEEAVSMATAAQQTLAEAAATYRLVLEGPRPERLLQARAQWDLAQAHYERLQDMYHKFTVRAPFDGFVIAENTEVGEWVSRGDPVVEMIAIDSVEIQVAVPEAYIDVQRPGQPVSVRLEALPGQSMTATITRIIPQADLRSRTFPLKILLENTPQADTSPPQYRLKAGMLARVSLAVSEPRSALMVSKDALVLEEGRSTLVFVIRTDPKSGASSAVAVPVRLGIEQGAEIEVIGDLRDGERVVIVGNERLSRRPPFTPVNVQQPTKK